MHSSIDIRGVQTEALRTNLFSDVRLHQTSILFPQSLDNSLFHKNCLEASMIALINLLNVNRVQNQRTGRLNYSPPIITGVELSPTAATGRFFFFLRRALEIKISGTVHVRPFIHCLYVTVKPVHTDTEETLGNVRINSVSVLSGLNTEKMYGISFPRDKVNCPYNPPSCNQFGRHRA